MSGPDQGVMPEYVHPQRPDADPGIDDDIDDTDEGTPKRPDPADADSGEAVADGPEHRKDGAHRKGGGTRRNRRREH